MRRVVNMLAAAASRAAIPPIPSLANLASLDLDTYNRIRISCPSLNLPVLDESFLGSLPGIKQLEALREAVQRGIQDAIDRAERTPLGMIDKLESQLQREIDKVLAALGPFSEYLNCACSIASGIEETQAKIAQTSFKELSKPSSRWTLLDGPTKASVNVYRDTVDGLKQVIAP